MAILSILVINNHGLPRLTRFYNQLPFAQREAVIRECFNLVSKRADTVCNFLEGTTAFSTPAAPAAETKESSTTTTKDTATAAAATPTSTGGAGGVRLIYRHYATLYFIFAVDGSESELGILDLIQVFVEALDKCFENVCELDLIFHCDKVHFILDEIVMAGMVLETSLKEIIKAVDGSVKYARASEAAATARPPAKRIGQGH